MILLSHPTANQNVRQSGLALAEAELLEEFWTCINWKRNTLLDRLLSFHPRLQGELRRRSFGADLQPFIKELPWREWGRLLTQRMGLANLGAVSTDAVYHSLDRHVARRLSSLPHLKAIYAYDDGALETFRVAKRRGLKCIYEHPTVYWRTVRELQRQEAELQPEWAATLLALRDPEEKLARKDQELALSDAVIVASSFARESLAETPSLTASISVIPYGAPDVRPCVKPNPGAGKLRILFAGALTQAKGLSYLLEAVMRLKEHIDLTLIGRRVSITQPAQSILERHRWIPSLPHENLLEEMSRHDLLVLPSLHEGFGLVILEAMAQATPVITTAHTCGRDLIEDGVDGFLVPIRSPEAIAERLELLLRDRSRLAAMKEAARTKALACAWQTYRRRVVALAQEVVAIKTAS